VRAKKGLPKSGVGVEEQESGVGEGKIVVVTQRGEMTRHRIFSGASARVRTAPLAERLRGSGPAA